MGASAMKGRNSMMTNEEAIRQIDNIMIQLPEDSAAAEALFKAKIELSQQTKYPYVQCPKCGYWFVKMLTTEHYDEEFNIHEYFFECPRCSHQYEENDCYWR